MNSKLCKVCITSEVFSKITEKVSSSELKIIRVTSLIPSEVLYYFAHYVYSTVISVFLVYSIFEKEKSVSCNYLLFICFYLSLNTTMFLYRQYYGKLMIMYQLSPLSIKFLFYVKYLYFIRCVWSIWLFYLTMFNVILISWYFSYAIKCIIN